MAGVLRFVLRAAEVPYATAIRVRNHRYDTHRATIHWVHPAVVSVGNLTLGGTGKTPMVGWIVRRCRRRGVPVAVISRGYKAAPGQPNDEALLLRQELPEVPHLENPDRVQAARQVARETGCRLIVLDDAFQHRRIGRDLDIVLLDALEPFGFGHVFPRGTLREPLEGLRRAAILVLTRADAISSAQRHAIRQEASRHAREAAWAEVAYPPRALVAADGAERPLATLSGQPVLAFCGIGNPEGFRHTLQACGCRVVEFHAFADHHRYRPDELERLGRRGQELGAAAALCTQKDMVKLTATRLGPAPLWAVRIGLEFLEGLRVFEERLDALIVSGAG
jgi:tetraacyldisaccharide 4'-kinase